VRAYGGVEIAIGGGRLDLFDMTAMWRACKSPPDKSPYEWLRLPYTVEYIKEIPVKQNTGLSRVLQKSRDRNASTKAIWEIAVAYAEYLDHGLHREILNVYRRVREANQLRQQIEVRA
jgi:hypothetical protein